MPARLEFRLEFHPLGELSKPFRLKAMVLAPKAVNQMLNSGQAARKRCKPMAFLEEKTASETIVFPYIRDRQHSFQPRGDMKPH